MSQTYVTRRSLLKAGTALAGAVALPYRAFADPAPQPDLPALVVFFLNGGPSGLFNSAASFLNNGAFGYIAGM